jgi:hypothetical protein
MAIKLGGYSDMKSDDQQSDQEVVVDKYSGEEFQIDRNSTFITTMPHIINNLGTEQILNLFHDCPFDDVEYIDGTSEHIPSKKVTELQLSYKYPAEHNKDHMTISYGSPEFSAVLEVMDHLIPEHPDFATITYMQIVHYKENAFFPFHKDIAEDTDFGTAIVQLNEGYKGGQLNVHGNVIANNAGTITFFNNSTQMWHGVEPIYEGERFVLLIWFGRNEDEMRDGDNDESDSEMQSVSEGTESGDTEVPLTDKE